MAAAWTTEKQPYGQNRSPLMAGWASDGSGVAVPVAVDPVTGRILVNATGSSGGTSSTFGATFPTTGTAVGASDGTNMQPLQVDGAGNLKVNVEVGGGGGTQYTDGGTPPTHPIGTALEWNNAGAWATAGSANPLPISGTVTANAGTNMSTASLATSANLTAGTQKTQIVDGSGNVIASTSNALNVNVTNSTQAVTLSSTTITGTVAVTESGTWNVGLLPATSGGLSMATGSITATATAIKTTAGQVYGWYFYNSNATVAYVTFYNTVTGSTTIGTNIILALGIPATSGANLTMPIGLAFSTAITIAVTTTRTGNTSPGNSVDYNVFYD